MTKNTTTLFYPQNDYAAADVAIRVHAFATGQGQKVKIIPKHFGREEVHVAELLNNTFFGLLIAQDKSTLDEATKMELDHLIKNKKPIVAIVSEAFKNNVSPQYPEIDFQVYENMSAEQLPSVIEELNKDLNKEAKGTTKNSEQESDAKHKKLMQSMLIIVVLALTLLLLGMSNEDE